MKVHGALLGVTRHRLAMSRKGLAFLKGAVETACNVPAARKTWAACGRAAAASVLKGIRSRLVATETTHEHLGEPIMRKATAETETRT